MLLKKSLLLQKPFYIISSSSNLSHPCTYPRPLYFKLPSPRPPPLLNFVLSLVTKTPTRHSRETTTWSNDKQQIDVEPKNGPHMWSLVTKFLSVANSVFFRKEIHLLSTEQGPLLVSGMICNSIVSGMIQEQFGVVSHPPICNVNRNQQFLSLTTGKVYTAFAMKKVFRKKSDSIQCTNSGMI